eukprot:14920851-Alexandrium_andersonii.AAC.1
MTSLPTGATGQPTAGNGPSRNAAGPSPRLLVSAGCWGTVSAGMPPRALPPICWRARIDAASARSASPVWPSRRPPSPQRGHRM